MKKLGLITYKNSPKIAPGDQLLVEPLKKQGFNPVAVPWDDEKIDWSTFDVVIFRSSWNYHRKYEQFLAWLDLIEKLNIPVWNSISIIRWNSNKKYLKDLEYKGIPIVPTVFVGKGEKYFLSDIANHKHWTDLVIKPAIGIYSYNVQFVNRNDYDKKQKEFEKLSGQSGVLIQPYMEEAWRSGEYSFVFIGNEFSHAVVKTATNKITIAESGKKIIRQAVAVIEKINSPLLYARVDAVIQNDTLNLTELELIEPRLYFDTDPRSPVRFAKALKKFLSR
jgi:hypothetical protein